MKQLMIWTLILSVVFAASLPRNSPYYHHRPHKNQGEPLPSLIDATLDILSSGLQSRAFTSVDLVNAYVARVLEANATLHCVTELNPDALAIAADLDAQRKAGKVLGPLHGVPILLKNNMGTNDKMSTTAGSFALLGAKLPRDSTVVAKLRSAGAIILGKANLSQWANFRSTNSSNGWSAYGGQTLGAYYPNQDPSGSSSGSGVSSSIGLALAALGTETDGSILSPSDVNNLVGIKPTVGLTSRYLVIPISEHQDTVGPMARTVKDAAYLLQAIAGTDSNDNYTSAIPNGGKLPNYVKQCRRGALRGRRIGVARNVLNTGIDAPVLDAFNEAIEQIKQLGATVVDANFTAYDQLLQSNAEIQVLNADFLVNLATYLSELTANPTGVENLVDVRTFTQGFPAEAYPDRNTGVWDNAIAQGFNNTDPRFWAAYQQDLFLGGEGGVLGALNRTKTDAILLPTQFAPNVPAIIGSPVVTVPLGFYPATWNVTLTRRGLVSTGPQIPFGLSFLGAKFSEADLIGFAYDYEQLTHHRNDVQPYFVPNIELDDVIG